VRQHIFLSTSTPFSALTHSPFLAFVAFSSPALFTSIDTSSLALLKFANTAMSNKRPAGSTPGSSKQKTKRPNFEALRDEDPEFFETLQTPVTKEKLFDKDAKSAPSTAARRVRAREMFEQFCNVLHNKNTPEDVYDADTLVDYTCRFVQGMERASFGKLSSKVKRGTLEELRRSLEWTFKVMCPTFSNIADSFHDCLRRHIDSIVDQQNLSVEHREKNNLGTAELGEFFDIVMAEGRGVNNWKQHYVAWVLTLMTAVRPGSLTVVRGYFDDETGEPLTLRWSDVQFKTMNDGIGCLITLRSAKGHHDLSRDVNVEGRRDFIMTPTRKDFHLDVSALLFGLAVQRGLFLESVDQLLSGDLSQARLDPTVAQQAVFITAGPKGMHPPRRAHTHSTDQPGVLNPRQEMGFNALNPKLQEMCVRADLFGYFTITSLRRDALNTKQLEHGDQAMRELRDHVPANSDPRFVAVQHDFSRSDASEQGSNFENIRLTDEDIRVNFSALPMKWQSGEGTVGTLSSELEKLVDERFRKDIEITQLEVDLRRILLDIHTALQEIYRIDPDDDFKETGNMLKFYTDILHEEEVKYQDGIDAHCVTLEEHLAHRKTRRRDIKIRLRNEIKKEMQLKASTEVETATATDTGEGEQNTDTPDADSDVWKDLEDGVVIVVGGGHDGEDVAIDSDTWYNDRVVFIEEWIAKVNRCSFSCLLYTNSFQDEPNFATSGLTCMLCEIDFTIPQGIYLALQVYSMETNLLYTADKDRKYTLSKLTTHCKSTVHTRKEQCKRAFNNSQVNGKLACVVCGEIQHSAADYVRHTERKHPDRMWENKQLNPDTTLEDEPDSPVPGPSAVRRDSSSSSGGGELEYRFFDS
jgi:hypothetical protein